MATAAFLNQAYLAYFGRPVDYAAVTAYVSTSNADVETAFYNSAESQALYGNQFNAAQVNSYYENLFGRMAEPAGIQYWLQQVALGNVTPVGAAIAILNGAQGSDAVAVQNKLAASAAFTTGLDTTPEILGYNGYEAAESARSWLFTVTDTPATPDAIAAAIAAATAGGGSSSKNDFYLTTGQDTIIGTSSVDAFYATVAQNVNGEQTNQLGTGDRLDGGSSDDSLFATVQHASPLNNGPVQAITPTTTSIENAWFTALTSANGYYYDPRMIQNADAYYYGEDVLINAKYMKGLDVVASLDSDASLTISNLTTLTNSGLYEDRRNTDAITIRMDHTGNGEAGYSIDPASNMTVLFDNDYLLTDQTTTDETYYWLLDQTSDLEDGPPLARIDSDGLTFTADGVTTDIFIPRPVFEALDGTWEAFVAALNDVIAGDPDLAGYNVTLDYTNTKVVGLADLSASTPIPAMVLSAPEGVEVTSTGFHHFDYASGSYNVYGSLDDTPSVTAINPVTSNVELFKVGRGADGGELIIGGMATDFYNDYGYSWSAIKEGVERFNVTVFGDETQFSSLSGLHSTNNTLRIVNVVTDADQTGTFADLMIGNSNTHEYDGDSVSLGIYDLDNQYALKDVQIFDASGFKGDLSLYAALTDEVTSKYLDIEDQAPDAPAADNVTFQYTGGVGNDMFNVTADADNWEASGSVTREDFTMNINGGDGNDDITLALIDDGDLAEDVFYFAGPVTGEPAFYNWYDNQVLLANLSIDGGDGDDTIWTPGSGNVIIDAGTGDDTVYADNTGDFATWAFNVENYPGGADSVRRQLDNLQSDANDKYNLYNAQLTVTYLGFEVTVTVPSKDGVTSDLDINQAIKLAVNADPVLNKLLWAHDGPANTLVVHSSIDGEMVADDLTISLAAPASLTSGEVAQLNSWYGTAGNEASLLAAMDAQVVLFDDAADYDQGFALSGGVIDGSDSEATSDNTITPNLGDDVVVLGTGYYSNDTVVYHGYGNGIDSIVNFDSTYVPAYYDLPADTTGPVKEVFTVTFGDSDGSPAAQTIIFDGDTVTLSAPADEGVIPSEDVAYQFYLQFDSANYEATAWDGVNTVTLTAKIAGVTTDVVDADFTGTYNEVGAGGGNGTTATLVTTQGAGTIDGSESEFTVNFSVPGTAAAAGGSFTFDTVVIPYLAGDGALTLQGLVDGAAYPNWSTSTSSSADGNTLSVTFTATAVGPEAIGTAADFDIGDPGIVGSVSGTVGVDDVDAVPVLFPAAPSAGLDYLDFSTYNPVTVAVDGVAVAGMDAIPVGGVYIDLVESLTNDGEYTINEVDGAVVTLIGVADFGVEQTFIMENFII